jgi:hypothetical protein
MKNYYLLILFIGFCTSNYGQSQNQIIPRNKEEIKLMPVSANYLFNSSAKSTKGLKDTIFLYDFLTSGQFAMVPAIGGGWIAGVNYAGTKELAQGIRVDLDEGYGNYKITDILFMIGGIQKVSENGSTLKINICAIDDSSKYSTSTTEYKIACPGTILKSVDFPWQAGFDTLPKVFLHPYMARATLDVPLKVENDYAIVMNMENFYKNRDTIGFLISGNGGATSYNGLDKTWWKYPGRTEDIWTLWSDDFPTVADRAFGFFPIIDVNVGIKEASFLNGMKLDQNFPNPSTNTSIINYALKDAGNVYLEVFNSSGEIITRINEGTKPAGVYSITLDMNKYSAGNYYYSLVLGEKRMTRKMVVTK